MLGLNRNQWLGVAVAVIGALLVSKSQLDVLFGAGVADKIIALAGILNLIVGGIVAAITGQTGMANQLGALKGVRINVDATADKSLAKLAVDPTSNVDVAPGQAAAVAAKAST